LEQEDPLPRLKFDLAFCLLALAAPGFAKDGDQVTAATVADSCAQDPCKTVKAMFPDSLERETFLQLIAKDGTHALTAAVADLSSKAAAMDPAAAAAFLRKAATDPAPGYAQQVNDALWKARTELSTGLKNDPPKAAATDYTDPVITGLLADAALGLPKGAGPGDLYAKVNVQKYGGGAPIDPIAGLKPCPAGTIRTQSTLDALKAAVANGGSMSPILGQTDGCTTPPPAKVDPKTDPTNIQTPTATVPTTASTPVKDSQAGAPPAPGADKDGSGGGFFSGIKNFFSGLPTNQILAGVGFGAAVGMLFGFGTPVGMIGGALIGGLIGAVLGSGVIGKLFGGGGTGGS
jgi:hypothetical protein